MFIKIFRGAWVACDELLSYRKSHDLLRQDLDLHLWQLPAESFSTRKSGKNFDSDNDQKPNVSSPTLPVRER